MVKIAISGKARTGKNTIAEMMELIFQSENKKVFMTAFADPIKNQVMNWFPDTDREILWGASELRSTLIPGTEQTYRQLLIEIGQLGRKFNPNIWINQTLKEVDQKMDERGEDQIDIAVITDNRFHNEFLAVKKDNYLSIRIIRPDNNYNLDDISETDLDHLDNAEFDYVISNDSDISSLRKQVKKMCKNILQRP